MTLAWLRHPLFCLLAVLLARAETPVAVFDVRTFGAVGDGQTVNTQALQAAIDACSAAGGGTAGHAANPVAELTPDNLKGRWPEYSRFNGTVPAHGFYARHIRGLTLRNGRFATLAPDARPAVVFDDVVDAHLTDVPPPAAPTPAAPPPESAPK
ncbi:MAG TPA: hypothetical protein VG734_00800 [Lacunisphaera sp.]|nr:hypothetical protein [Lacunisphaera sp.]